jgi:hypothetical protein
MTSQLSTPLILAQVHVVGMELVGIRASASVLTALLVMIA